MKKVFLLFLAVGIFSLLFLFLPMGTADGYELTGHVDTYGSPASKLLTQYREYDAQVAEQNTPAQVVSEIGYIWCDKDGNGIGCYVNSALGPRAGGTHSGEDLQPTGGFGGYNVNEIFAVCPFAGTVTFAGYDVGTYSGGYCVTVQITEHVDITYMHLGYGAGKAVQYSGYTTAADLVSRYPFQNVGYPDQWVSESEWLRQNGVTSFTGVANRVVGPSSILVSVGDEIEAGTLVGVPGDTGNSTGLHAHFRMRYRAENGVTYYGRISEVLEGVALKDLTWHYFDGSNNMYDVTALEAGLNIEELNIQIKVSTDAGET